MIAVDRKRQAWAPMDYFPGRTALVAELRRDPQKNVASLYLLGKDWLCKIQADLLSISFSATLASMRYT